jgi:hypothetical protein
MAERRDPVSDTRDPDSAPGDPPSARDPVGAPGEEVPALGERDLSRRRDRQASVVLVIAAAVAMVIWFPLGLVIGLLGAAYAYKSGARIAFWVAIAVVCIGLLSVIVGLTDFDGGVFQG